MLTILESKGYVTMMPSPKDARALSVTLTNKTKDFMDSHENMGEELITRLYEGVSEEDLEVYEKVCNQLFDNIERMNIHEEK